MRRTIVISLLSCVCLLCCGAFSQEARANDFTVTQTTDANGTCVPNNNCSLRQAVNAANASPTNDRILFASSVYGQILSLTLGELYVGNQGTLTIESPGLFPLSPIGIAIIPSGSRIFFIDHATLTINNLTLGGGNGTGAGGGNLSNSGGAVLINQGVLTLNGCFVTSNTAWEGGAIYNFVGTLNLNGSLILNNSVSLPSGFCCAGGGGIYNIQGVLITDSSTISSNAALIGGGIYSRGGRIDLTNTAISDNRAISSEVFSSPPTSGGFGGGLHAEADNSTTGVSSLKNVTIANNFSNRYGAGVDTSQSLHLHNTVIGGNRLNAFTPMDPQAFNPDVNGAVFFSDGYNLIGVKGNSNITGLMPSDIINVDPKIGADLNNGFLSTPSLQPNSPGMDSADPANYPSTDLRGYGRPTDGNGDGVTGPDRGACESGNLVTTDAATGVGSLTSAVSLAPNAPAKSEIVFSPDFFNTTTPRVISLSNASPIQINKNLIINGTGVNLLTIDGAGSMRIFEIMGGASLTISNLRLAHGNAGGGGGGAFANYGTLTVTNLLMDLNTAAFGGAIYTAPGANTRVTSSTISHNVAQGVGGAVANDGSTTIDNSTIANNTALTNKGGGIYVDAVNNSVVSTTNTTISGNRAGSLGGGVYVESNPGASGVGYNLRNTIVADNTATGGCPDVSAGIRMYSYGYNLVDKFGPGFCSAWDSFSPTLAGNITNPVGGARIAPLADYGSTMPTVGLLTNSPAIDAGDPVNSFATDQRGVTRPLGGRGDIGAFERSIVINETAIPYGRVGVPYNDGNPFQLTGQVIQNFAPDFFLQFSVVPPENGDPFQQLPPGLSLSSNGQLTGTPTGSGGIYTITIKAIDAQFVFPFPIAGVQQYRILIASPTAATVNVSGRVLSASGSGLGGVKVVLTDQNGGRRMVVTDNTGAYSFGGVAVGELYVITAQARHYSFASQAVYVIEEMNNLNFTGAALKRRE